MKEATNLLTGLIDTEVDWRCSRSARSVRSSRASFLRRMAVSSCRHPSPCYENRGQALKGVNSSISQFINYFVRLREGWIQSSCPQAILSGALLAEVGAVKVERSRARGPVASNTLRAPTGAIPWRRPIACEPWAQRGPTQRLSEQNVFPAGVCRFLADSTTCYPGLSPQARPT